MLHTTSINERKVTYWEGGAPNGTPVVLIHGLGGDHRGLLNCIASLTDRRLLVPDLPGYGQSEPFKGDHTLEAYADFIDAFLKQLTITNIVLVGYSFGGTIALTYSKEYPGRLQQLILLNPVVDTPQTILGTIGKMSMSIIGLLPERIGHWFVTNKFIVYVTDRIVMTPAGKPYRRKILQEDYASYRLTSLRALQEGIASLDTVSASTLVPETPIDTLLVAGTKDIMVNIKYSRAFAKDLSADYVEMEGGHLLPLEDPIVIGSLLRQHVQS
jgi:pimeloyl-ACP methyl ester carboxylesterase